jgi:tRNA(Arg) A34 adenosine deaminase TadA
MSDRDRINRRDFLVTTAGAAGTASVTAISASAQSQPSKDPPPFHDPLIEYWRKPVSDVVDVDARLPSELQSDAVKERHQIYSALLMKLMVRFWNGNKRGPFGEYPRRAAQREPGSARYRGDMIEHPDGFRVNWDRYLGHNIACLAVDGNGEIIDFEFNHNDFFRSSAEHAESRMVRRLFSLADIFDNWKTGKPIPGRSRAFSLKDVTLYTSLESCAQCSGVMSLGRVKQVVYLQTDPGAYAIGNIMFNLAGTEPGDNSSLAAIPIAGSKAGVSHFDRLNSAYAAFREDILDADAKKDMDKEKSRSRAFFISADGNFVDYGPSITSFLCTDVARDIFADGARLLDGAPRFPDQQLPGRPSSLTNQQCLEEARRFYAYADIEGYRGSPHKL